MANEKNLTKVIIDNPIEKLDEDLWSREKSIKKFVSYVINMDCSKGLVVGIFAPWGNGKTSFFNLAKSEFIEEGFHIFDFNPWMFGNANQLVFRFFHEIASEIKSTTGMKKIGKFFGQYGGVLSIAVGAGASFMGYPNIGNPLSKILDKISSTRRQSATKLRTKVEDALRERDKPIIVVLDDVDRLSTPEIKDVFKLVRLTANFPNLVYVLLFDRERVEKALQEEGITGRDYLDKIIQIPYNLPTPPRDTLNDHLQSEIHASLQNLGHNERLDPRIMTDIYGEIIFPLIRNMRDIRRYVAAVRETLGALTERISVADLLALESVRLFQPDLFELLPVLIDDLTIAPASRSYGPTGYLDQFDEEQNSETRSERINRRLKDLYRPADKNKLLANSFIFRIFISPFNEPDANSEISPEFEQRLLHDRRVAHRQIFHCYFERVDNQEIRDYHLAKYAVELINDRKDFETFLFSLPEEQRSGLVRHLWQFTDSIRPNRIAAGIISILNISPNVVFEDENGLHEVVPYISWFIRHLLEKYFADTNIDTSSVVFDGLLSEIFDSVSLMSSQYRLIKLIESVSENQVNSRYWQALYLKILNASPDVLTKEYDLAKLYKFAKSKSESREKTQTIVIDDSPEITFAILYSVRTFERQGRIGTKHISTKTGFESAILVELFGNEEELESRIFTMIENSERVLREFEGLGVRTATVQSVLSDAQRIVFATQE